ncbi:MAG TPA: cytochrome c biogenesis protein CcdA [Solirubrobacteraceae bacterium]|jgi:cytochrome c biogenesis protein CcdA/thiol-disulfide isomerase/thioredoxin|nr:cytochrome c biogenesis protein CcdA [Solirubrobacteraceae bacterium]
MVLLILFALVAGAGTAITPCVLPVLPALLSASALGGRRRPLGIVLGLAVTFTVAIVALAQLVNGVGLAQGAARTFAVVVLIAFGLVLLIPQLAQRVQAPLSRLARFGPKSRGDGFWTGIGVGAALGFVCAPCAGPILAAVISVSASTGPTVRVVVLAIAYALGLSAMMLLYGFGGRVALARIKRAARGELVERALGVVLLATGIAMAYNLDVRFENLLARNTTSLPGFLTDPTRALENSGSVQNKLASLRPASKFAKRQQAAASSTAVSVSLPKLGSAPNFTDTQDWFNTPGDRPLSITGLRGHVVLVDFWTYTCINCIRTLPFVEGLYKHYHRYGLDVVGVETPEFTFEQEPNNVRDAIRTEGITYPVVQDNRYGTWDAYSNQYWPAEYYIDATGEVRRYEPGEGGYATDEKDVRELLRAAGAKKLPPLMTARAQTASKHLGTAETYLDPDRATADNEDFVEPLERGVHSYDRPSSLGLDQWGLGGSWNVGSQSITPSAASATISGDVQARDVYLVMTSTGNKPRRGRVLINGSPITAAERGADIGPGGYFTVTGERLYRLVSLKGDASFTITVQVPRGVQAYDFTFG